MVLCTNFLRKPTFSILLEYENSNNTNEWSRVFLLETFILLPLIKEPLPFSATAVMHKTGKLMAPRTDSFLYSKAIEVPKIGIWCRKLCVPSIGSMTHL